MNLINALPPFGTGNAATSLLLVSDTVDIKPLPPPPPPAITNWLMIVSLSPLTSYNVKTLSTSNSLIVAVPYVA